MSVEAPLGSLKMELGMPTSIWTEDEITSFISGLDKADAFRDDGGSALKLAKRIEVESYPLVVSLHYISPKWSGYKDAYVPYPGETVFEAQFLSEGEVKVVKTPLIFTIQPDGESDIEDLTAHIEFELQFDNGQILHCISEFEDNGNTGDVDTLIDNPLFLPSNAEIISGTRILFNIVRTP